ncbi:DUF6500 family protein [Celeribacter halophilus]|uniref:DUF6500 family protein n=1 Tax=Celeribacter halophilus TaxID=576117 RepID=UPI003A94B6CF
MIEQPQRTSISRDHFGKPLALQLHRSYPHRAGTGHPVCRAEACKVKIFVSHRRKSASSPYFPTHHIAGLKCSRYVLINVNFVNKAQFDMRSSLRSKAVEVCNEKIAKKGEAVGLSFYAFFTNKNDDPELLMEAAEWWIKTHELNHFEKAVKIRELISSGS